MNAQLKPIKSEDDYADAIELMDRVFGAVEGTPEADLRDVLAVLIEDYEDKHYEIDVPDPITALKFRMEQAGLTQNDLVPLLGSRSKVSEVLSGKRNLSLRMIRALHHHLGIPAEVLISDGESYDTASYPEFDFEAFPVQEMAANGAFKGYEVEDVQEHAEECIRFLIDKIGGMNLIPAGLFRKSQSTRLNANLCFPALQGWSLHVLAKAMEADLDKSYRKESITSEFLETLVHLSFLDDGPRIAQDFLAKHGVILVIVPHLKKTYLDGAAFITQDGQPIVGLTLRYDRIDNFWFTLLHEIGHLVKHLSKGSFIADDMSLRGTDGDSEIESEADSFAEAALLPVDFDLDRRERVSQLDVLRYATEHSLHPAIIAGRIQYRKNNYRIFSNLVGRGEVGGCFKGFPDFD
jgi:HTH-type transcriptional regulator / antitoxin HigA